MLNDIKIFYELLCLSYNCFSLFYYYNKPMNIKGLFPIIRIGTVMIIQFKPYTYINYL